MELPAPNSCTLCLRALHSYHKRDHSRQIGLKLVLLVVLGMFGLAGCQTAAPPPIYPEISFTEKGIIRFNVAAIEVISSYVSPGKSPNIEHDFPYSSEELMWQWAEDRLKAVSSRGTVRVTIRKAAVLEQVLDTTAGLRGLFTREQSKRYVAELEAIIVIYDGSRSGAAVIKVERSGTIPEDLTLNERDQARYDFLNLAIADFNDEAERAISRELGGFLAADNV